VYWGVAAFDYLNVGGANAGGNEYSLSDRKTPFAVTIVQTATSNYDVTSGVAEDLIGEQGGAVFRIRYFNGKIRSLELVWTAKYNSGFIMTQYDVKNFTRADKLGFNQATAVCKAYGVQDTISWDKFVSLPEASVDDIFMIGHNTRVCKFLHMAMFVGSVQAGRPEQNANHCIHAAEPPRPDSNGQIKCHDYYKPTFELFSESEVRAVFAMETPEMVAYLQGEKSYLQREKVAVSRGSVVAGASTATGMLLTAVALATSV